MTMGRVVAWGYDVADVCPLRGAKGDNLFHRVSKCPCTRKHVEEVLPKWLWEEICSGVDESYKFWVTAMFPSPLDTAPLPVNGFQVQEKATDECDEVDNFGGHVYVDGSCFPSPIKGLARAGCAVIEVSEDGELVRQSLMPVPRHLPQTAQAAEYVAYALAMRIISRPADLAGDCKGVVQMSRAPLQKMLSPRVWYAGIVLDALRHPEQRRRVETRWVKAHRTATWGAG